MPSAAAPSASASTPRSRRPAIPVRARLAVASRAIAGLGGGYAVTALLAAALALAARDAGREEAVLAATTPAYLAFAGCIVWAFVARTAARAWLGIGLPALLLAALVWRMLTPT